MLESIVRLILAHVTACINNGNIAVTVGADNVGGIVGQTTVNTVETFAKYNLLRQQRDITGYRSEGERSDGNIGS